MIGKHALQLIDIHLGVPLSQNVEDKVKSHNMGALAILKLGVFLYSQCDLLHEIPERQVSQSLNHEINALLHERVHMQFKLPLKGNQIAIHAGLSDLNVLIEFILFKESLRRERESIDLYWHKVLQDFPFVAKLIHMTMLECKSEMLLCSGEVISIHAKSAL